MKNEILIEIHFSTDKDNKFGAQCKGGAGMST